MTPLFAELDLSPENLRHADSLKWTKFPADVLPLWVADMDFPIAPSIRCALEDRLHQGLGYQSIDPHDGLSALLRAKLERQGFTDLPAHGWIDYFTGVVPGLYAAVLALTAPGDDVLTMTPIYPPFLSAITDHGRRIRSAALREPDADSPLWQIDWAAMEAAITPATRLMLLCHPHNPTGRLWTPEELRQLGDFAERHRLWVVSDELHADLSLDPGYVPLVSVAPPALQQRTLTLTGPCKTYNTAGLGIGAMVSHNPQLITRIRKASAGISGHPATLSIAMWRAALKDDGAWLADVLAYLRDNRAFLGAFVRDHLPAVKFAPPQATYLAWLDYRAHPRAADIFKYLLEVAKVALNDGPWFGGPAYQGFVRLNFATSRSILAEALRRLAGA